MPAEPRLLAAVSADLRDAIGLLTRLPVTVSHPPARRAVWAYPVVGLLVGAIGGAIDLFCLHLGMAAFAAAIWSLAGQLLVTGALHEDGLADTADGFGGGGDRARKLAIMRDSRIGAFGAMALMLVLGLRVAAVAGRPGWPAVWALMAAGATGRAALVWLLAGLPPARSDGVAAGLRAPPAWAVGVGSAVAVAVDLRFGLRCVLAAGVAGAAMAWVARRQVGGYSGDVLGACEQVVEATVLSVAL